MADGDKAEAKEALEVVDELNCLSDEIGEPTSTALRRRWAEAWWAEKRTCPMCGGPVRHDQKTDGDAR